MRRSSWTSARDRSSPREWEEPVGRAADSLAAAGVARDEIDVAVITHAHPDHVPGFTELVDGERVPDVPAGSTCDLEGRVALLGGRGSRRAVDRDGPDGSTESHRAPRRRRAGSGRRRRGDRGRRHVAPDARSHAGPYVGARHIRRRDLHRRGDVVLTEWAFEHPEWTAIAEVDPDLVVRTRRALFDRLVASGGLLAAFHLPELGRIEAAGDAYMFVPA